MGALEGCRVVELAADGSAYAGKLLADLGADVIVVEPPGGSPQRAYGPFLDDQPAPERSLHWWHYHTSKRSVVLDLDDDSPGGGRATFLRLVASAAVLIEAERPGRLAALDLDYNSLKTRRSDLIHCAITPFGRIGPRRDEQATDLTVLAAGGPVWSCGYDDRTIPPVRGGGNQGYQTGGVWAVLAVLTALLHRAEGGAGQFIDVSLHAAANVTTELASYGWLTSHREVQRQTGRHAAFRPTEDTQVLCADGRYLNTGVPPRRPAEFKVLHEWLVALDLIDEFPLAALLEMAAEYEHIGMAEIEENPMIGEVFSAGRDAVALIASKLPAIEAFVGFQSRGIAVGAVLAPEDVMNDPHFRARGFPVEITDENLGRTFTYPGAAVLLNGSPMTIRGRAPRVGEHTDEVLSSLPD
jgi:crotonobetainyl-CoA:carnitine CoA-transferase CaiB-like acyl-CoA transferase